MTQQSREPATYHMRGGHVTTKPSRRGPSVLTWMSEQSLWESKESMPEWMAYLIHTSHDRGARRGMHDALSTKNVSTISIDVGLWTSMCVCFFKHCTFVDFYSNKERIRTCVVIIVFRIVCIISVVICRTINTYYLCWFHFDCLDFSSTIGQIITLRELYSFISSRITCLILRNICLKMHSFRI